MVAEDDDARRTRLGSVFGAEVDAARYDDLRPGYPAEAVGWLVGSPAHPLRVLDLAAGTGKVTRVLAELGHEVVAVDPSEPMLDALRRSLAGAPGADRVRALAGSAEDLPLPDAAVDAVVVGQAWHWMRPAAAVAQVRRVLRPGGVLGLAWNARDARVPWAAELERLLLGGGSGEGAAVADAGWWPRVPGGGARERAAFPAEHRLTGAADVVALATTHSAVAVSADREALLERVRRLAVEAAGPDGAVVVPTVCHGFRYRLT